MKAKKKNRLDHTPMPDSDIPGHHTSTIAPTNEDGTQIEKRHAVVPPCDTTTPFNTMRDRTNASPTSVAHFISNDGIPEKLTHPVSLTKNKGLFPVIGTDRNCEEERGNQLDHGFSSLLDAAAAFCHSEPTLPPTEVHCSLDWSESNISDITAERKITVRCDSGTEGHDGSQSTIPLLTRATSIRSGIVPEEIEKQNSGSTETGGGDKRAINSNQYDFGMGQLFAEFSEGIQNAFSDLFCMQDEVLSCDKTLKARNVKEDSLESCASESVFGGKKPSPANQQGEGIVGPETSKLPRNRSSVLGGGSMHVRRLHYEMTFDSPRRIGSHDWTAEREVETRNRWIQYAQTMDGRVGEEYSKNEVFDDPHLVLNACGMEVGHEDKCHIGFNIDDTLAEFIPCGAQSNVSVHSFPSHEAKVCLPLQSRSRSLPMHSTRQRSDLFNVDDDVFYDSDPGETLCSSKQEKESNSFINMQWRASRPFLEDDEEDIEHGVHLMSSEESLYGDDESFDEFDVDSREDFYTHRANEPSAKGARTRTMDLVVHPTTKFPGGKEHPQRSTAWIEIVRPSLHEADLHMNLVWAPFYKKRQSSNNEKSCSVDLRDILRIMPTNCVDRSLHPLAPSCRCFALHTVKGETYLFEAPTESDRDRHVMALKLIIARSGGSRQIPFTHNTSAVKMSPNEDMNASDGLWFVHIKQTSLHEEDTNFHSQTDPENIKAIPTGKEVELVLSPRGKT